MATIWPSQKDSSSIYDHQRFLSCKFKALAIPLPFFPLLTFPLLLPQESKLHCFSSPPPSFPYLLSGQKQKKKNSEVFRRTLDFELFAGFVCESWVLRRWTLGCLFCSCVGRGRFEGTGETVVEVCLCARVCLGTRSGYYLLVVTIKDFHKQIENSSDLLDPSLD